MEERDDDDSAEEEDQEISSFLNRRTTSKDSSHYDSRPPTHPPPSPFLSLRPSRWIPRGRASSAPTFRILNQEDDTALSSSYTLHLYHQAPTHARNRSCNSPRTFSSSSTASSSTIQPQQLQQLPQIRAPTPRKG